MPTLSTDVLESIREPGTSRLSPSRLAALLEMQQQELATLAGVHRNTLRMHPESPRLQATLRDLVRLLSAAAAAQTDQQRLVFCIKNQPVAALQHKSLLQVVQEGRTDDAIAYLESVASGFVG